MNCAVHPEVTARGPCEVCRQPVCDPCLGYEVDGRTACERCAIAMTERTRAWGPSLLALIVLGYLVTLAVGYVVFRGRPVVGGIAAIVAITLGRGLQILVPLSTVKRLPREAVHVDASEQAR